MGMITVEQEEYLCTGKHVVMDLYDVKFDLLQDVEFITKTMKRAVEISGANILSERIQTTGDYGYSIMFLLSESHFSLHVNIKNNSCYADIYTCGLSCSPLEGMKFFLDIINPGKVNGLYLERGNETEITYSNISKII